MEENLHKDKMDNFLKETFEQHQEDPSNSVWENISADLDADIKPGFFSTTKNWLIAALFITAAAVLFQMYYFDNKLDKISKDLETNTNEIEQIKSEKKEFNESNNATNAEIAEIEIINNPIKQSGKELDDQTLTIKETSKNQINNSGGNIIPPINTGFIKQNSPVSNNIVPIARIPNIPSPNNLSVENKPYENEPVIAEEQKNENLIKAIEWAKLEFLQTNPINLLGNTAINPVNSPLAIKLGFHSYYSQDNTQIQPKNFRDPINRKLISPPAKQLNGENFQFGLAAEAKVNKNTALFCGIDYRKNSFSLSHQPSFKYKERFDGQHGHQPPQHQHDFEYNLTAPTGVYTISVRASEADTSRTISEDEQLSFEVNTTESSTYLSIPIGVKQYFGKGRFRYYLSGGLQVNVPLKKDFMVDNIVSNNSNFKVDKMPERKKPEFAKDKVTLDVLAGFGLEYRLDEKWSLQLEPRYIKSISHQLSNKFASVSSNQFGLNAGLTYQF